MPVAMIAASCAGSSLQLSSVIVTKAPGPCNSSTGSASGLGMPGLKDGPMARMSTCIGAVPVMMNPPMPTFSPVPTRIRVERLRACAGRIGVGVGVIPGVGVETGVPVGVAVGAGVEVGVTTGVGVGVGVGIIGVGVGVGLCGVGVGVGVAGGVGVGVGVIPGVGVGATPGATRM